MTDLMTALTQTDPSKKPIIQQVCDNKWVNP